jgi:hypothetical protein
VLKTIGSCPRGHFSTGRGSCPRGHLSTGRGRATTRPPSTPLACCFPAARPSFRPKHAWPSMGLPVICRTPPESKSLRF